jgi:hypothetical protein
MFLTLPVPEKNHQPITVKIHTPLLDFKFYLTIFFYYFKNSFMFY